MTARRAVDFPEPDSTTSPTTSFGESVRLNSLTAGRSTPPTAKPPRVLDLRGGRQASGGSPGVEAIAQALRQEVETYDRRADASAGPSNGQNDTLMYFCASWIMTPQSACGGWVTQAEITQGGPAHEGQSRH